MTDSFFSASRRLTRLARAASATSPPQRTRFVAASGGDAARASSRRRLRRARGRRVVQASRASSLRRGAGHDGLWSPGTRLGRSVRRSVFGGGGGGGKGDSFRRRDTSANVCKIFRSVRRDVRRAGSDDDGSIMRQRDDDVMTRFARLSRHSIRLCRTRVALRRFARFATPARRASFTRAA